MVNCMICKRPVTKGLVVCGDCADKLKPYTLPPDLALFMDYLADTVVNDPRIQACGLCAIGTCRQGAGPDICRNAVKAWLLKQAEHCFVQRECA